MSLNFFHEPKDIELQDKFKKLSTEEKETLKLMFAAKQTMYLKSIKENIQFFFYLTIISIVLSIFIIG